MLDRFADGSGGFYDTADDAERLFQRPQDPTDNATPSGQFAAAGALLSYAALTGSARHREAAEAALGTVSVLADEHARFAGWGLAVARGGASPARSRSRSSARRTTRARAALHRDGPARRAARAWCVALGEPGRRRTAGRRRCWRAAAWSTARPAAYVCRGFTCRLPVTTPRGCGPQLADLTGSHGAV